MAAPETRPPSPPSTERFRAVGPPLPRLPLSFPFLFWNPLNPELRAGLHLCKPHLWCCLAEEPGPPCRPSGQVQAAALWGGVKGREREVATVFLEQAIVRQCFH